MYVLIMGFIELIGGICGGGLNLDDLGFQLCEDLRYLDYIILVIFVCVFQILQ